MRNILWLLAVPFLIIGLVAYITFGFIRESIWGNNDDLRDPCDRFGYYEMLEFNKKRIGG